MFCNGVISAPDQRMHSTSRHRVDKASVGELRHWRGARQRRRLALRLSDFNKYDNMLRT